MNTLTTEQKQNVSDFIKNLSANVNENWKEYTDAIGEKYEQLTDSAKGELFYKKYY